MEKRFPDMILYQGKVTKKWDDGELDGDGEELFRVRYDCVGGGGVVVALFGVAF